MNFFVNGSRSTPAGLYALLIVFGSLYPFTGWSVHGSPLAFLSQPWPWFITRTDLLTNLLAYFPLGALLVLGCRRRAGVLSCLVAASVAGSLLSLGMEALQSFLPHRHSAFADWAANSVGSAAGAMLAVYYVSGAVQRHGPPPGIFGTRKRHWIERGLAAEMGVWLIGIWILSQFSLELPALIGGRLHRGFIPAWQMPPDPGWPAAAVMLLLEASGCGLYLCALVRPALRSVATGAWCMTVVIAVKFAAAALLLRLSVLPRLLSLEVAIGLGAAFVLTPLLVGALRRHPHGPPLIALVLLVAVERWMLPLGVESLGAGFNVTGLGFALSQVWPMFAIAHLLALRFLARNGGGA